MRPALASLAPIGSRFLAHLMAALLVGLLSACASAPPAADTAAVLSGRLSVRVAGGVDSAERSATLAYELRGNPQQGQIDFSTPLGSVVARARWSADRVDLITEQGQRHYADLDSMSRDVLGEVIPVAALFDWLRGRPWPAAASRPTATGFEQLGWQVDLSRFADSQLIARRDAAPAVTVRALVDRR